MRLLATRCIHLESQAQQNRIGINIVPKVHSPQAKKVSSVEKGLLTVSLPNRSCNLTTDSMSSRA